MKSETIWIVLPMLAFASCVEVREEDRPKPPLVQSDAPSSPYLTKDAESPPEVYLDVGGWTHSDKELGSDEGQTEPDLTEPDVWIEPDEGQVEPDVWVKSDEGQTEPDEGPAEPDVWSEPDEGQVEPDVWVKSDEGQNEPDVAEPDVWIEPDEGQSEPDIWAGPDEASQSDEGPIEPDVWSEPDEGQVEPDVEPDTWVPPICISNEECNDGNPCTGDWCEPSTGCIHEPHNGSCNDGNACTKDDICWGGNCVGMEVACGDQNSYTEDSCDPATGCLHVYGFELGDTDFDGVDDEEDWCMFDSGASALGSTCNLNLVCWTTVGCGGPPWEGGSGPWPPVEWSFERYLDSPPNCEWSPGVPAEGQYPESVGCCLKPEVTFDAQCKFDIQQTMGFGSLSFNPYTLDVW